MLGRTVLRRLAADHDLTGVDLAEGDLTDQQTAAGIIAEAGADWVVHCAAWTDVDGAETSTEQAMAANAVATGNVARACDGQQAGLCFISTDYVFDGQGEGFDEADTRRPVNHYGLTKARAEDAVMAMDGPWQILRTSWLFGDGPKNFVKTVRQLLDQREQLRVVDDQRGSSDFLFPVATMVSSTVQMRGPPPGSDWPGGSPRNADVIHTGSCRVPAVNIRRPPCDRRVRFCAAPDSRMPAARPDPRGPRPWPAIWIFLIPVRLNIPEPKQRPAG
jgi:dTDP-4-dehydrorhamnose reductase